MSKTTGLDLDPERIAQTRTYCEDLQETVLQLIDEAIGRLAPAGLQYTHARAGFAMNRRLPTERGVQNRPFPDGPVDHDVPVLKVVDPTGESDGRAIRLRLPQYDAQFLQFLRRLRGICSVLSGRGSSRCHGHVCRRLRSRSEPAATGYRRTLSSTWSSFGQRCRSGADFHCPYTRRTAADGDHRDPVGVRRTTCSQ